MAEAGVDLGGAQDHLVLGDADARSHGGERQWTTSCTRAGSCGVAGLQTERREAQCRRRRMSRREVPERERERLFVAVPLPEEPAGVCREGTSGAARALAGCGCWVRISCIVTLAFIGEVDEAQGCSGGRQWWRRCPGIREERAALGGFLSCRRAKARVVTLAIDDEAACSARLFDR